MKTPFDISVAPTGAPFPRDTLFCLGGGCDDENIVSRAGAMTRVSATRAYATTRFLSRGGCDDASLGSRAGAVLFSLCLFHKFDNY